MGNVGYRFLICFFDLFLIYILLINYMGWSGAYISFLGTTGNTWRNSYFGFSSVQSAIKFFKITQNVVPYLAFDKFAPHLNSLVNAIFNGLPQVIENLITGDWSVWEIVETIITIFAQPIVVIARAGICVAHLLYLALNLLETLLMCVSGAFNIPFDDMPTYTNFGDMPSSISAVQRGIGTLLV